MIDIGRVFRASWTMLRERFWRLLGMWTIFFAIQIGGFIALGVLAVLVGTAGMAGLGTLLESPEAATGVGIGMVVTFVLLYAAYMMLVLAQQAALVTLASPQEPAAFGSALGRGFKSAPPFFAITALLLAGYFGAGVAIAGLERLVGGSAVGDLVTAVLALPLMIYLACRLSVIVAVVAVDEVRNPVRALRRCWALTRGKVGSVLLALLAFGGVTLAIFGLPFAIIFGVVLDSDAEASTGMAALLPLVFFPVLVLYMIFAAAFSAALHHALTGGGAEALEEIFA